jgi:hypothetical protein
MTEEGKLTLSRSEIEVGQTTPALFTVRRIGRLEHLLII